MFTRRALTYLTSAALLSVSSSAFAFGWSCDGSGFRLRFTLNSLNSGTFAATPNAIGAVSLNGRFWDMQINNSWIMQMDLTGAPNICFNTDGGAGRTYNCINQATGASTPLWNCEGTIF